MDSYEITISIQIRDKLPLFIISYHQPDIDVYQGIP